MPLSSETSTFEEILSQSGELTYTSRGYSMYPLIRQNEDVLHIVKLSRPLKRQDVVLYKDKEHHYVLHRILRIRKDGMLVLAGDHNYWKDPLVPSRCVLGMLKDITKKDGKVIELDKDRRLKGWLYVHFFHVKALCQRSARLMAKLLKTRK